jgi:hypothetical protein
MTALHLHYSGAALLWRLRIMAGAVLTAPHYDGIVLWRRCIWRPRTMAPSYYGAPYLRIMTAAYYGGTALWRLRTRRCISRRCSVATLLYGGRILLWRRCTMAPLLCRRCTVAIGAVLCRRHYDGVALWRRRTMAARTMAVRTMAVRTMAVRTIATHTMAALRDGAAAL